jgi:ABC-type transport system involved in multi-copper enzyme maturation permease subunit
MAWHIFKKDLRLLWPFGIAAAILQFAIVAVHLKLGVFEEQPIFSSLLLLLESMMYFGVAVLIAAVVHEDSVVGMRQDWLVRPIRRRDLLAAKLLFLLLAVQVPMLLAGMIGGLANGFPLWLSFSEALSQNAYFLIGFTLPIFAFVSLTRSTSEALGVAFVIVVANILGTEALILPVSGSPLGPTSNTGLAWIPQTWRFAIFLVGALAILAQQYFRRATRASRLVLAATVVICLFTQIVPWNAVFAWQKAIAPASQAAQAIAVRFDPAPGPPQSAATASAAARPATFAPVRNHEKDEDTVLHIPIVFSGIPGGSILKIDRAIARLTAPNTTREQIISAMGDPDDFEVPDDGQPPSEARTVSEILHVRGKPYTRLKDTPVTIELDYSATLLNLSSTSTVPAVNGDLRINGLGHCETRLNESRTEVEFRCLNIGNTSQCTTVVLQDPATGLHNPPLHGCRDDYAPYFGRYKPPDTIMHTGFNFDFRDPSDLIHYPVNESMVNGARVIVKNYSVAGHLTMHLTIPGIRLADLSTR